MTTIYKSDKIGKNTIVMTKKDNSYTIKVNGKIVDSDNTLLCALMNYESWIGDLGGNQRF